MTDHGVGIITLDDERRRNAFLARTLRGAHRRGHLAGGGFLGGARLHTGAPPAFCAGADLTQLGDSAEDGLRRIYDGFLSVARTGLPTVAAVNGPAVGAGLNLALACDLRIAGASARFDCRFLELGIHPGGGHTWMLRRIVGPQTAAAMVLCGEVLDADSAVQRGLAWERTDDEELLARATGLAAAAAAVPRDLSLATKATLSEVVDLSTHGEAVDLELAKQLESMNEPAFAERLAKLKAKVHGAG
ncbi:MAG: enoyl-CoA hydratase-related protein [Microthrixaceae bacterium]